MHFREPLISEKLKFLALTHVWMYGYWCCQVAILSACNASVMFLLHSYQSIMWCYNVIILLSQVSGLFDQRYLKMEYTCTILIFFHKKHAENLLSLNSTIPKTCKKWPRNGNSQVFKKLYYWLLISFDFWILWLSILKDLLALTLQTQ